MQDNENDVRYGRKRMGSGYAAVKEAYESYLQQGRRVFSEGNNDDEFDDDDADTGFYNLSWRKLIILNG